MRHRARLSLCFAALACGSLCAGVPRLHAQPSLSGKWRAGATSMQVAIQSWGKDCGPRPQSTQSSGGGTVEVEHRAGVVTIRGVDRDVRSDRCFSPNPAMRKVSSSARDGVWTTRCKTPDADPRQESGTYTLRALGEDRLEYKDVSYFNWRLNDSTCVATITTTQTLQRVGVQPAAQPSPSPAAQAAAPPPPCTPGRPARLVLRPRHADLELGQRQCFRARVLDAAGCEVPDAEPRWSLQHAPSIKARLERGCFRAGERSAESEGEFKVVAAHAGLRAEATVQVSAVSLPGLIAKRMEIGAVQGELDPTEAPAPKPAAASTSRLAARTFAAKEPASGRRWLVALAAALLVAASAMLLRVRARPRTRATARSRPGSAVTPSAEMDDDRTRSEPRERIRRCPKCGAGYPETSAFCGEDGSALAPPE